MRPLHIPCWPDTAVLVRVRWSLKLIGVQEKWLVLVTTALTVTHTKIQERKIGREEEMKAGIYKLSDTDRNNVSHLRFVTLSLLQSHFSPTSHSGCRNSSISFDPPLHYYIAILKTIYLLSLSYSSTSPLPVPSTLRSFLFYFQNKIPLVFP
jgi:hypothetical protein